MQTVLMPPAQLWLGSPDTVSTELIRLLQLQFCAHAGCAVCITCKQIQERQHYAVVWINPEKNYTLDQLEIIQERMAYALHEHEHCFFILERADFLTTQCANSLLKSMEEPPAGYHILLCAERQEYILPTISSRCIIHRVTSQTASAAQHIFYAYFTATVPQQPAPFLKEVQECTLSEEQSLDLTDRLLAYWMQQAHDATSASMREKAQQRIELFKHALLMPPMPGSTKLFWKNLFLLYHVKH